MNTKNMPEAFHLDLCKFHKDLQQYARTLEPDADEAQDLVQETFYKAMRYREQFNHAMSLRGWLFTILKNTRINTFRKKKFTSGMISSENVLCYAQLSYSASGNDGEHNCVVADIYKFIGRLQPEYQTAISYFLLGYKYHEIAKTLGIPLGTVKFRIFAAKAILKAQLKVYQPF